MTALPETWSPKPEVGLHFFRVDPAHEFAEFAADFLDLVLAGTGSQPLERRGVDLVFEQPLTDEDSHVLYPRPYIS